MRNNSVCYKDIHIPIVVAGWRVLPPCDAALARPCVVQSSPPLAWPSTPSRPRQGVEEQQGFADDHEGGRYEESRNGEQRGACRKKDRSAVQAQVESKHWRLVLEPHRYSRRNESSIGRRNTQARAGTKKEEFAGSREPSPPEVQLDKLDTQLPRPLLQLLQL